MRQTVRPLLALSMSFSSSSCAAHSWSVAVTTGSCSADRSAAPAATDEERAAHELLLQDIDKASKGRTVWRAAALA